MPRLAHKPAYIATPINASYPKLFASLNIEKTTISDFPQTPRFKRLADTARHERKEKARRNKQYGRGTGNAWAKGFSKYPFGRMAIGNSFFVPLFNHTKEEQARVTAAVHSIASYHYNQGHLPTPFSLAAILSNKDGRLGLAFFRIS